MLDLIAHPLFLCALGLAGSLGRTMFKRHEESGERITPWGWVAAHPYRALIAVGGAMLLLAVFSRAGLLDGKGITPALLAVGAGAFGSEAFPLVLDKGRAAVKKALGK